MEWIKVPGIPPDGKPFIKKLKVAGKSICLVRLDGEFYAVTAKCPHAGADLSAGWCEGHKLVCPYHRYSYDLATGKGSPGQHDSLITYPVKTEGADVYVGITSFWEKMKQAFK